MNLRWYSYNYCIFAGASPSVTVKNATIECDHTVGDIVVVASCTDTDTPTTNLTFTIDSTAQNTFAIDAITGIDFGMK